MSINIRLKDIVDAAPALAELGKVKFPTGTAFRVMKLIKAVRPELEDYYKARSEKVNELGLDLRPDEKATDEEKQVYLAKVNQFEAEIMELLTTELISLPVNPLPFTTIEKLEVAPLHLEALMPFLEMDTPSE